MRIKLTPIVGTIFLSVLLFHGSNSLSADKPVVYFGIGMRYQPIVMYERFQPMMDYLTQNTPYRFELRISRSYSESIRFLNEGKTQICLIGDGGLFDAMLKYGVVPIVKPLNEEGKPVYHCYFVVPENSPIQTLSDLKGKRIAFGSRHSTTGNLIPREMLRERGIRTEDFGWSGNVDHNDAVARMVLKGEFDAAAIKSTVAQRYRNKGLRIVATSADLPSVPLIARKDAPRELVDAVTRALVKLDRNSQEHQKIMADWDREYKFGFVPARISDYSDLIRKFKSIPDRCGERCHR